MIDAIEANLQKVTNLPDVYIDDILHYIKALNFGIERVVADNFPISLRFIRELHKQLMEKAQASDFSDPGEFRKTQNWISCTRTDNAQFVPPPVIKIQLAL